MVIEKIIEYSLRLFIKGEYNEAQAQTRYEEIQNLRIYLDDTDITETLSFGQLFDIEAATIKSIKQERGNIQKT